ncbi:PAP2 domain protein [Aspergillus campestris IBT 28561]|uniref:PAP2 domain protein n=1 Tax=Aspergillus campestris (strain IBT 28561) TaxID=1392248 RepID=A0A2I1DBR0_ASPC2|nr:PAP2 domain protein [Aspergillus campestris IBT 28561]PKY07317.1 PAP2 domain protein [Aspergillus campestris IBT 28561]
MTLSKELPRIVQHANNIIPKRLILSYIADWVFIALRLQPNPPTHTPFSLTDASISYPHAKHETVSTGVMVVVSLIAPGVIIAALSLVLVPGSSGVAATGAARWRYKIWEWHAGWLGLALAVAGVFMATEGLKDLYGRPRPDLLARCDPDLENIGTYAVGGWGGCCRGRRRWFLGGYAGIVAFAGLSYFSLWLCAKFSVAFPYFAHSPFSQDLHSRKRETLREQGAAPPIYMVIIAFVPWAVAWFISASRWFDHRHHAFDIIFGSVMGMVFAWVAFRLYHISIMRGAGWAWGPRNRSHALYKGVGLPSQVGTENWAYAPDVSTAESDDRSADLESGRRDLAE